MNAPSTFAQRGEALNAHESAAELGLRKGDSLIAVVPETFGEGGLRPMVTNEVATPVTPPLVTSKQDDLSRERRKSLMGASASSEFELGDTRGAAALAHTA